MKQKSDKGMIKDEDGNEVEGLISTQFDETVYAEKVKLWIKEDTVLESTV